MVEGVQQGPVLVETFFSGWRRLPSVRSLDVPAPSAGWSPAVGQ